MSGVDFAAFTGRGRHFSRERRVRLSDTDYAGRLRVDGLARYLQDIASDDWDDTGIGAEFTWVVRRNAIRLANDAQWPTLGETVKLTTWCCGNGVAWAERRTDLSVNGHTVIEASVLWVPVDQSGQPQRIPKSFFDVYAEAANGRKVSGRVEMSSPPTDAVVQPWPLRQADFDVVRHVNNAALWVPLFEVLDGPVASAVLIHHGAVDEGADIRLMSTEGRMWLVVDDAVKVSARFTPLR